MHNVAAVCAASFPSGEIMLDQMKQFVLCLLDLVVRNVVMLTFGIEVFLECFLNLSGLIWDSQKGLTNCFKPVAEVCFAVVAVCVISVWQKIYKTE